MALLPTLRPAPIDAAVDAPELARGTTIDEAAIAAITDL